MTTALLSDRARVELALPAALLYRVMSSCVEAGRASGEVTDQDDQCLLALSRAALAPLDGLPGSRVGKLRRRINRLQQSILNQLEHRTVMVCFLIVLFWLRDELDKGSLTLVEGSDFDQAVTALLPQLEAHDDLWTAMQRSATRQAARIGTALRSAGYYR